MTGTPSHTTSTQNDKQLRLLFYTLWLLASLLQAALTEVRHDEAYYWKYSQHLAWGYFDHPPVIALMVKAGYTLFQNELGVRLLSVLCSTAFLYIMEKLVQPVRLGLYYLSVLSIGILHLVGIMAVPDVPLLLFSASFFYLYRLYLDKDRPYLVLLLSLNIALLLLSKYHGILLIAFTILSNISLLRRRSFWAIAALSLIFFIPHIAWQLHNDFPSIKYHFFDRSKLGYKIDYTTEYLLILLLIFGPLTGTVLMFFSLKKRVHDQFEKSLKYNLIGILLFFTVMTFNGRVEGNWLLFAIIPALYLGYNYASEKKWYVRFVQFSFIITIFAVIVVRWYLMDSLWPKQWAIASDYKGWKAWAQDIKKVAQDRPVAFMNSYQNAAMYEFYTGGNAFSLDNVMGRKNQYSLWSYENKVQGREVVVITNYYEHGLPFVETAKGNYQYDIIPNFYSSSNIRIDVYTKSINANAYTLFKVIFSLGKLPATTIDAEANPQYPFKLSTIFFNKNGFVSESTSTMSITNEMLHGNKYILHTTAPGKPGDYSMQLGISAGWLPPSINMGPIQVHVD